MRPFHTILTTLLVSFCLAAALPAQTVQTIPVGFNTASITPATDATHPKSSVVSVPFYQIATFQGATSTVDSSNQISFTGTTFTSTLTGPKYLARFKTGNSVGRFFIISSFTNTQLTLDTTTAGYTLTTGSPSNTQAQIAPGDSVEILPANTLASLFGTGANVVFQTGSVNTADNIFIWNKTLQHFDNYFHNGTNWRLSGNGNIQDNFVVLPDAGLFIQRRGTAALNLTFLGTVPSTTERTDYPGPASSFVNTRFPIDYTFKGSTNPLNLQNVPGWTPGSVNTADQALLWNNALQHWDIYFYNGTNWRLSGNGNIQDNTAIPLGTPIFIVRRSTAAGNGSTFAQTLPYTL
jgi:uncharacterized protein (TIGR02597 family)